MKTRRDSHVHGKLDRGLEHANALFHLLRNSPGQHCLLTTGSPYIPIPESSFSLRCSIPGHSLTGKVKMKLKILRQAPHIRSKAIVNCSFVGLPCPYSTYNKDFEPINQHFCVSLILLSLWSKFIKCRAVEH